jgi:hypothetical protein
MTKLEKLKAALDVAAATCDAARDVVCAAEDAWVVIYSALEKEKEKTDD